MVRLPVSGLEIALRKPDGLDDMLVRETLGSPIEVGLALVERLAGGPDRDWTSLVITDFEFLLLSVRAARFGQQLSLAFACPHCRELAEVRFRVSDFLESIKPRAVPGVAPNPDRPGWFCLDGLAFRLPTVGDLIAVAVLGRPATRLVALCMDETAQQRGYRARVERAMAAMAPELSRPISDACPSCGAAVQASLSVTRIVVSEMRRAAADLHDEVDLLARAYHWSQADILSLPQDRRHAYAERVRRSQSQAA
jgi:hypothetical protein